MPLSMFQDGASDLGCFMAPACSSHLCKKPSGPASEYWFWKNPEDTLENRAKAKTMRDMPWMVQALSFCDSSCRGNYLFEEGRDLDWLCSLHERNSRMVCRCGKLADSNYDIAEKAHLDCGAAADDHYDDVPWRSVQIASCCTACRDTNYEAWRRVHGHDPATLDLKRSDSLWVGFQLWLHWSDPEVDAAEGRELCQSRQQMVWTVLHVAERLEILPSEMWMLIFTFIKHEVHIL